MNAYIAVSYTHLDVYKRQAYTGTSALSQSDLVIDPGCFRVAYTAEFKKNGVEMVIDPGCFRVAYTWDSKTSLYNKV